MRGLALDLSLLIALVGAACSEEAVSPEPLPTPSAGRASAVPDQPPVVWLAAQTEEVTEDHIIVVMPAGPTIRVERLSGDATRFLTSRDGRWAEMAPEDAALVEIGTPLCVETLLDGTTYLALRVFVGAACGPST